MQSLRAPMIAGCLIQVGPAFGSLVPTFPALVSKMFGTRSFTLLLGFAMVSGTIVFLFMPSMVGFAWDLYGTYQPAWLGLGALALALVALRLRFSSRAYTR